MKLTVNTRPNGQHLVKLAPQDVVVFDALGEVPLAGRTTTRTENVAAHAAIQAHKAICWSRGRCLGHDVH